MSRASRNENSALWAAYGDALGFMTELAPNERIVRQRVGDTRVTELKPWRRRIGGQYGVEVELPFGCYSDDTELRMATARAIRPDGTFDIVAFANVELVVWQAYALGGGRSTRAAAASLNLRSRDWFNNFFGSAGANYLEAGGNGSAMRVQPHVWAAERPNEPSSFLSSVVTNTVATHGHPRAIVGAAFHAVTLGATLASGNVPSPDSWEAFVDDLGELTGVIAEDEQLSSLWQLGWEQAARRPLVPALTRALEELREELAVVRQIVKTDPRTAYEEMVLATQATAEATRGSAPKTAVLSLALAWLRRERPNHGLVEAVNVLGSDTDSIASMAGAILGAACDAPPPSSPMDAEYIKGDALRLSEIADRRGVKRFGYPDPMRWQPKGALDLVGFVNGQLAVAGLGPGSPEKREWHIKGKSPVVYQWLRLDMGQTLLCRRRTTPPQLPGDYFGKLWHTPTASRSSPEEEPMIQQTSIFKKEKAISDRKPLAAVDSASQVEVSAWLQHPTPDEAYEDVRRRNFDPTIIGGYLLEFSLRNEEGHALSLAFAALVAKAWRSRKPRS